MTKAMKARSSILLLVMMMDDIFYELKQARYTPLIKFECGRITMITAEFNGITFDINRIPTSSILFDRTQ